MSHKSEAEYIEKTHNTARFFTEHRQVSMVLFAFPNDDTDRDAEEKADRDAEAQAGQDTEEEMP